MMDEKGKRVKRLLDLSDFCDSGEYADTESKSLDYDPVHFLRCHSKKNDSSDLQTQIMHPVTPNKYLVTNKTKMKKSVAKKLFQYKLDDMEKAVKAVQEGKISKKKAAKLFNVPKTSLLRKIKGDVPIRTKMGPATILTVAEEALLEEYILSMYKKGFPVHKENICNNVGHIMKKANRSNAFPNGRPGKTWFKAFLKRHPKISERNAEALTKARAAVSVEGVKEWFNEVQNYFKEEGLEDVLEDPSRVFNADETGFKLCPKTGKVLCEKGDRACYIQVQNNEKEQISVLGCFAANGDIVPPMVIYPYKRLPKAVAESVPDGWGIGLSSSGWMNSEIFYEYLSNCFIPYLKGKKVTLPVVLFVDGYRSHITTEVSELCSKHNIILIAFHPNSTHFLQPADVSVFGPLKREWQTTVRNWKFENYPKEVTKETFAKLLQICLTNLTDECIKSGFRTCGVYPFSPDAVNYNKVVRSRNTANPVDKLTVDENLNVTNPNEEDKSKKAIEYLNYMEQFIDEVRLVQFSQVFKSKNEWWEEYPEDITSKELYEVWRRMKQEAVEAEIQNDGEDSTKAIIITVPHEVKDIELAEIDDHIIIELDQDDMDIELPEGVQDNIIILHHNDQKAQLESEDENCQRIDDPVLMPVNVVEKDSSPSSSDSRKHRDQNSILSPFKTCLMWPKTPPKTNSSKRTKRKKFPSVVSSEKWKTYFKKREQEKLEKEKKKSNRKKKNDDDWICKNCNSSWNDENKRKIGLKWVNCDRCRSAYHFKCIPKSHKDAFGLESDSEDDELNFTCHLCTSNSDEDDEI